MVVDVLSALAAKALAAGAVALFREVSSRKGADIDRAVRSTCDQFTDIPGAGLALEKWVKGGEFEELFRRAQTGERDFDAEEVISSFMIDGDFDMPSEAETRKLAEDVVCSFLGTMIAEIYRSETGIVALANRQEELALRGQVERGNILSAVESVNARFDLLASNTVASAGSDGIAADSIEAHSSAKAEIDLARELIDLGHIQSARGKLESVRAGTSLPVDLEFRVATNLGACAAAEGDYESACFFFDEAYALQPDNPKGVTNASVAARLRDDLESAMNLARRALDLESRNGHAAAVIIESLWEAGENEQLREFIATHAWVTSDRQSGLVLADVRTKQARFEEAAQLFRSFIEDDPNDARAHLMLSQSLFAEAQASFARGGSAENTAHDRLEECVEAASRAIDLLRTTELKSQLSSALVGRGFARALQGHIDSALDDLNAAIRAAPDDSSPVRVLGLVMMLVGRYEEARDAFEQVRASGSSEDVLPPLAEAYLRLGDPLAAKELIRGEFEFENPGPDDLWKAELVCRVDAETEGEDPAWEPFEESLRRQPENPWLLAVSAIRGRSLGDFEGAEDCLLKALSSADDSGRPEVLFRLGNLYRELERFGEAADAFLKMVDGSARHPLAVDLLICLSEGRRLREALKWAREIRGPASACPSTSSISRCKFWKSQATCHLQ